MSGKIFISYTKADRAFARRLYRDLHDAGFKAWLDQHNLRSGEPWDEHIEASLKESAAVVVILSPEAVASRSVLDEVSFALDVRTRVVPVLLRDCTVPLRLNRLHYVDFRGDQATAMEDLLATLGPAAGGPPAPAVAAPPAGAPRRAHRSLLYGVIGMAAAIVAAAAVYEYRVHAAKGPDAGSGEAARSAPPISPSQTGDARLQAVASVPLDRPTSSAEGSAGRRYYGVVDLGSKGSKAALYGISRGDGGPVAATLLSKTINTGLASSMKGPRFTADGIREAAKATGSLIERMKAEARDKRYAGVSYSVVGSSGVAKGENRGELAAAVKAATGIDMTFIDARTEGYLGLVASIPPPDRGTAVYVDIGSGNTKLGCLVGDLDESNFRSGEIPYGSVSGRNEAARRSPANIPAGIAQLMQSEVRPAYEKQSLDIPCLRNRGRIYWTGGAAWSTATMMHPEKARLGSVRLTRTDLASFLARLADGTWNQKKLVLAFPKGTSSQDAAKTREAAEKDHASVLDTFDAEDLLSGVSIMRTLLEASNPSAEIYFVRDANYTRSYALERYREAGAGGAGR